ncbi:uncharacterized protein LOC135074806 [Ostrinia nubilalis]|uniref:uncharacterized protein LOC135074806 n=1 Tax=Ostrinia nubilalis TaxID=29057 RepID=UPI0030825336
MVRNRSSSRTRKISPGCLAIASAPAPRAKYRESNASRLRQEIKGMTVTGIVRQQGPRSKSSSPSKMYPQSSTPKQNSGCATPKNRCRSDTSPEKTMDIIASRLQNSSNAAASRTRSRPEESPDKSLDLIATPRSMSETSNASRETQDRIRSLMAKASSGYVVDTRSKTINTAVRQPASEEALSVGRKAVNNTSSIGK